MLMKVIFVFLTKSFLLDYIYRSCINYGRLLYWDFTTYFSESEARAIKSLPGSRSNSISGSSSRKDDRLSGHAETEERSTGHAQPVAVANDDEVEDIMAAMQESVRRSWSKNSESESGT